MYFNVFIGEIIVVVLLLNIFVNLFLLYDLNNLLIEMWCFLILYFKFLVNLIIDLCVILGKILLFNFGVIIFLFLMKKIFMLLIFLIYFCLILLSYNIWL